MASSSRRKSGKGSSRKRTSSGQAAEPPRKKKQRSTDEAATEHEEPLFQVAKIVATKKGKNGVTLYKTRWEGYTPADDTWEPLEHVGSTGHVDRYERKQREMTLSTYTPGVAVIEYDDGERQTIDLLQEKFRSWMEIGDDERDDDSVTGDDDVNNFDLIFPGAMIELLWPYAEIYFSCKVISWSPIEGNGIKKSAVKRHGSLVWDMKDSEAVDDETDTRRKRMSSSAPLHGEGACQTELKSGKESRKKHSVLEKSGGKDADRVRADRTYEKGAVNDKRNDSTKTQKRSSGLGSADETPKPTADVHKRYKNLEKKSLDKSKIPNKTRGLARVPSGRWQVQYYYCGSARYIGIYESKKDAIIAYETVRQVLENTNTENLSNQEISSNINLAKKLAEKRAKEEAAEDEESEDEEYGDVDFESNVHDGKCVADGAREDEVPMKKKSRSSATTQKRNSRYAVNEEPKPTADVHERYEDLQKKSLDKSKISTNARGIALRPSGKWQVQYYYCGSIRYIGLYESKKDALIIYETVHQILENTNTENLSNQECSSNIKQAKKLAEKRAKEVAEEGPEDEGASHAKKVSASEDKGDSVHTKKRSRSNEKNSAAERESDDAPMKKSRSSKKERPEMAAKKKPQIYHALLKKDSVSNKSNSQGKKAEDCERQSGTHVSNHNADTKKPVTHQTQIRNDPKGVSEDDNSDAISSAILKHNVSEERSIDTSPFGTASKQLASTQTVGCTESLPDDMDIDALAALVSMRRSQAAASSSTDKHDGNSQAALKGDDDSHLDSDSNKKPAAKPKVGRGIPLYSDHEYDTSDDEWRGEQEFFQAASHPRDGPKKLSFEEMWMMKLHQTQQIMDRNSGCRRW